jgi:hypothetical protein
MGRRVFLKCKIHKSASASCLFNASRKREKKRAGRGANKAKKGYDKKRFWNIIIGTHDAAAECGEVVKVQSLYLPRLILIGNIFIRALHGTLALPHEFY